MDTTINFYLLNEDGLISSKKLYKSIKSKDPMYLDLKTDDTIVIDNDNLEYLVTRSVKNLNTGELNIYITKIKSKEEIMDEIEVLANKTLKTVLNSIKDTFDSDIKK